MRSRLAEVRAPTLVIHSKGDRRIPVEVGRDLAASNKAAKIRRAGLRWLRSCASPSANLRRFQSVRTIRTLFSGSSHERIRDCARSAVPAASSARRSRRLSSSSRTTSAVSSAGECLCAPAARKLNGSAVATGSSSLHRSESSLGRVVRTVGASVVISTRRALSRRGRNRELVAQSSALDAHLEAPRAQT